jgi:hypothetical protein
MNVEEAIEKLSVAASGERSAEVIVTLSPRADAPFRVRVTNVDYKSGIYDERIDVTVASAGGLPDALHRAATAIREHHLQHIARLEDAAGANLVKARLLRDEVQRAHEVEIAPIE